jgi:ribosomal protein S21
MSNIRVKNRGKNDTIDRMLKRFKRAFQDAEIKNILTDNKAHKKPSVTKRRDKQTAIYQQKKLDKLNKEEDGILHN